MKNEIYASTGAFTGRANGYNYNLIKELAPAIRCDGFELLIYSAWYDDFENIMERIADFGLNFPVVHFDKCIGMLLADNTRESVAQAMLDFKRNVWAAQKVGAKKAVFHLWGGEKSDISMASTVKLVPEMYRLCDEAGIELLIENIPSKYYGPLFNWRTVKEVYPKARFIYDTRFGEFHAEHDCIMKSALWISVKHIHISSYQRGNMQIWGLIRPILHPGEGSVDFDSLISRMPEYAHSVTLESPVLSADGIVDVERLNRSLEYLYDKFEEKSHREEK